MTLLLIGATWSYSYGLLGQQGPEVLPPAFSISRFAFVAKLSEARHMALDLDSVEHIVKTKSPFRGMVYLFWV